MDSLLLQTSPCALENIVDVSPGLAAFTIQLDSNLVLTNAFAMALFHCSFGCVRRQDRCSTNRVAVSVLDGANSEQATVGGVDLVTEFGDRAEAPKQCSYLGFRGDRVEGHYHVLGGTRRPCQLGIVSVWLTDPRRKTQSDFAGRRVRIRSRPGEPSVCSISHNRQSWIWRRVVFGSLVFSPSAKGYRAVSQHGIVMSSSADYHIVHVPLQCIWISLLC